MESVIVHARQNATKGIITLPDISV